MTKTLVVGDLHGRWEIVEAALKFNGNIVFVGDYLDSYTRSPYECCRCLSMVLDACESMTNVTALFGNHEESYLGMPCSGHNVQTQTEVNMFYRDRMLDNFKYYT